MGSLPGIPRIQPDNPSSGTMETRRINGIKTLKEFIGFGF
jgi:hypothetical protein